MQRWLNSNHRISATLAAVTALAIAAMLVGVVASVPADAQAPPPADVAATCGDLAVLSIPEGPRAVEAAESLRSRGAPNPAGIEDALDVIVAAADPATASPDVAMVDAALATLQSYYGGPCADLDRCGFIVQIAGNDDAVGAEAARLLRRIETPAPPGIDAALALIAGDITESPFHADVAEARAQVLDYYPCGAAGEGSETEEEGTEGGAPEETESEGTLAFTGGSTASLAALGITLVAGGALVLQARRRLDSATEPATER